MDHLSIRWEFEKEGFELPGGRYLPDFWLPGAGVWMEIKGGEPSAAEKQRLIELGWEVCSRGQRVRLLAGDIPRKVLGPRAAYGGSCKGFATRDFEMIQGDGPVVSGIPSSFPTPGLMIVPPSVDTFGRTVDQRKLENQQQVPASEWTLLKSLWIPYRGMPDGAVNEALAAARSARFEFGYSGCTGCPNTFRTHSLECGQPGYRPRR